MKKYESPDVEYVSLASVAKLTEDDLVDWLEGEAEMGYSDNIL